MPAPAAAAHHRVLRALALLVILALAALFAWREETSLDLGFHLASGRYILEHGAWPRTDPFTYTVATHPYIDMHGLFQIAFALAERAGGMLGIALLREAFVLATLGILWASARRRGVGSPALLAAGFGLAIAAWELRFIVRPELASCLLLAAELYLLRRHAEDGRARWLWMVPALQLVWVNAHALSMFGIAVLGLYALATLVRGLRRPPLDRTPWIALAAACVALFVNPYGIEGVRFLWELRTRIESGNVFGESIGELASPFSAAMAGMLPVTAFQILLVATGVALIARGRRLALFDVLIVLLFAALAATRVRNLGLFVVAALPVALEAAGGVVDWLARRRAAARRRNGEAVAFAIVALVLAGVGLQVMRGAWYASNQRPARVGFRESPAVYPLGTLRTRQSESLGGPVFNTLEFGGYLISHLWPREKVFIDGRLEVLGEAFYSEYLNLISGAGWPERVRPFQPKVAFVSYTWLELVRGIAHDPEWELIDVDAASVLFARRIPENRVAIDHAIAHWARENAPVPDTAEVLAPPAPVPLWRRCFAPRRFPFEHWGRGNALLILGLYQAARREYARALAGAYPEPVLVRNYAVVSYTLGRRAEARAWVEQVVRLEPDNQQARRILAELSTTAR
jgi:hypothetical protein